MRLLTPRVNRVEVIDQHGRVLVLHGLENVTVDIQDDGRTLKVLADNHGIQPTPLFEVGR